ncbi:formylglycine-generating enzyme family protein [Desulfovibrio sp. OttesenSCG-928-A18]|nr:formylglycine-generating enzyme family protein [Desulfovibrio sp. OttesenSCG-928-A18]
MKTILIPTIIAAAVFFVPALCQAAELVRTSKTEIVLIKGGTFTMGSPADESWRKKDETQHQVTLRDFYIGRYEVTQEQYKDLMGSEPGMFKGSNLPVENVTWFEAVLYCNALSNKDGLTPAYTVSGSGEAMTVAWERSANGYRLPTEAEWEYAARAGTTTPFNTENSISPEEANYYGHYPYMIEGNYFSQGKLDTKPGRYRETTVAVGSFSPNKFGLYDMHGNVGEWVWDYYGSYPTEAQTNPAGPGEGTFRVNRGGGWNDFAKHLRSAYRAAFSPFNKAFNIGFRLARNAE